MRALTTVEEDLIFKSRRALDRYDRARAAGDGAELIKSRRALELVRSELEQIRAKIPRPIAIDLVRKALQRPIDPVTGLPIDRVVKSGSQRVVDHRADRFDKLARPGALSK